MPERSLREETLARDLLSRRNFTASLSDLKNNIWFDLKTLEKAQEKGDIELKERNGEIFVILKMNVIEAIKIAKKLRDYDEEFKEIYNKMN